MKTSLIDYLLSSIFIVFILLLSYFLCSGILIYYPLSIKDFIPIIYFLLYILFYGLFTALFLKLIRVFMPFEDGRYTMKHRQFTLWKLHAVLMQLGLPCLRLFIPIFLRPLLYSIFGATIGKQCAIGGKILDPYLTVIEDQTALGEDSLVAAHIMTNNQFILGKVLIRNRATVGVKAIIMPGVEIGENSIVLPGSMVPLDTNIPANEIWGGNPARKIKDLQPSPVV